MYRYAWVGRQGIIPRVIKFGLVNMHTLCILYRLKKLVSLTLSKLFHLKRIAFRNQRTQANVKGETEHVTLTHLLTLLEEQAMNF
jgi:hypothetical protein